MTSEGQPLEARQVRCGGTRTALSTRWSGQASAGQLGRADGDDEEGDLGDEDADDKLGLEVGELQRGDRPEEQRRQRHLADELAQASLGLAREVAGALRSVPDRDHAEGRKERTEEAGEAVAVEARARARRWRQRWRQ